MFVVFIGTRPDVCWLLVLVGSASTGSELSFGHFNRSSLPIVRSCTHELTKCFKSDLETCLGDSVITFEMDNCHAFWNYMAAKHCQSSPASPTRHSINDLGQWEIHWVNYTYTSMWYHCIFLLSDVSLGNYLKNAWANRLTQGFVWVWGWGVCLRVLSFFSW